MNPEQRKYITKVLPNLVRATNLNEEFFTILTSQRILSRIDVETIQAQSPTTKQASELYRILQTRTGAYQALLEILKSQGQIEALKILNAGPGGDKSSVILPEILPARVSNASLVSVADSFQNDEEVTRRIFYNENQVLGKSGNTTVFNGTFRGIEIAVKRTLKDPHSQQAEKETATLLKIGDHPNIVKYYDFETTKQYNLLALELCICTLNDWVKDNSKILPSQLTASQILIDAINGLHHLHSLQIVHRDLKPTNILVSVAGNTATVKLADFGISKFLEGERSMITMTSGVGTEKWFAPEVLQFIEAKEAIGMTNEKPIKIAMGKKTDIFSLGLVFYFVLSNCRHPFGDTSWKIRDNIVNRRDPNLEAGPKKHRRMIQEMIQFSPASRPSCKNISEMLGAN